MRKPPPFWIAVGLYPLLLLALVVLWWVARHSAGALPLALAAMAGVRMGVLLWVEHRYPARPQWRMTWPSFRRDLKYMATNGAVMGALKLLAAAWAIDASRFNTGLLQGAPLWAEVVVLMLAFEFFQYWYHRLSHEGPGRWGRWLWRVHAAHHLPDRVYLLMHPVGHPINLLFSLLWIQLPLVTLGASSDAIFWFNALMGLQGLVSHWNVDIQAGPLNWILVGTQLHRLHHSALPSEAKNYGVLTPVWDLVFGTYVRPGKQLPQALGVVEPERYPDSNDLRGVLAMPFQRDADAASPR